MREKRGERGSPSRQHPPRPTPARARSVPPCPALALQPRSSAYTERGRIRAAAPAFASTAVTAAGLGDGGAAPPAPDEQPAYMRLAPHPPAPLPLSSPRPTTQFPFVFSLAQPSPFLPLVIARSLAHMQAIPSPDRCIAPLDFSRRCSPCASIAIHALSLYVCCSFKVLFPPFLVFAVHASSKHQYFAWLSPSPRPDAHVKTAVPPSLSGFATVFSIGCILKWTAFVSRSGDFSL